MATKEWLQLRPLHLLKIYSCEWARKFANLFTVFSNGPSGVIESGAVLDIDEYLLGVVGAALVLGLEVAAADLVARPHGDPLDPRAVLLRGRPDLREAVPTRNGAVHRRRGIHCQTEWNVSDVRKKSKNTYAQGPFTCVPN